MAEDLAGRDDVELLLWRFYSKALSDPVLAEPFTELRAKGLRSHIPVMGDFWETVLFRAGLYRGSALTVHRELHARHPLAAQHFVRWLTLWTDTVDELFEGPHAERAKLQAGRIAKAMHRRLAGTDAAELDALVAC
ncbi:cyanoglobin [Mycolicibacterium peregrinum]|uniref:Group III truncated hemoglobin n=1 Tax=Mycolicibacterium peregrinum TaxID=43304 RepID=A0A246C081_MYCPR|nr:group III truncated hemoglobin [Mycolicibacterium peregrinum]OWM02505.1 cyanoglobin [Mycolicibacterium peregrinum]TGB35998.1 group III truncated hemoglobin [Mycolicibacterium peregrinum]TGB42692.1 group III truncated hemoglobin [Mycolicibacterium peregrinum]